MGANSELAISTMCCQGSMGECLERIARAGFRRVELRADRDPQVPYDDPEGIAALRRELERRGLRACSLHMPKVDLSCPERHWRMWAVREVQKAALAALRLGAEVLVVHPSEPIGEDDRERRRLLSLESLREVADLCGEFGVRLAVENVLPPRVGDRPEEVRRLVEELGMAGVGICLDVGHANLVGDPLEALRMAAPWLVHLHLADNHGRRDEHLVPGEGGIPWGSLLRELQRIGYRGPLVLEVRRLPSLEEVGGLTSP